MIKYNSPGDIHFVTFKTFENYPYFKDEKCCELFLEILNKLRNELEFKVHGYVIVPTHVHCHIKPKDPIDYDLKVTLIPEISENYYYKFPPYSDISYIGKRIKGASAREINLYLDRRGHFWMQRFFDFNIRTDKKFWEKIEYMHEHPIKHNLVKDIAKYKYSSWRNYELNDHSVFRIDYAEK